MKSPIVFALLAGLSAATYTICVRFGASRIGAVLGALVITGVALLVNAFNGNLLGLIVDASYFASGRAAHAQIERVDGGCQHAVVVERAARWLLFAVDLLT